MKHFFYGTVVTFASYGLIAFITWETNPENWTWLGRVLAAMLWMFGVGAGIVSTLEEKK